MLDYTKAIILAVVQGITEWLPVSSSGHLVLFQHMFSIEEQFSYDLLLHIATMAVILFVLRHDIMKIIYGIFLGRSKKDARLGVSVLIGTVPIGFLGFLFRSRIEKMFSSLSVVAVAFFFTGFIIYMTRYAKKEKKEISYYDALKIGLFQALALIPGISRSGSTISGGLISGISREEAARFSFLLFIPAMMGATLLNIGEMKITGQEIGPAIAGFLVTMVVSYISINYLLDIVKKGRFYYFAYYCWAVGIFSLLILMMG